MTLLQALILGVVQGLTEFLPVSSSGHLVLVPALLGWEIPADEAFAFDVLVQLGTLVAVIVYFWSDLAVIAGRMLAGLRGRRPFDAPEARLGWLILLATVPAGLAGVLFKDQVEAAFGSPSLTAVFLLVTAALLLLAERVGSGESAADELSGADALIVGAFQMLALFPGVSRSGSTIAGGMVRGLRRSEAARFSFLMAVPVMLAAGLLAALDLRDMAGLGTFAPALTVGFAAAAVSGYAAIRWLLGYLKRGSFYGFALYVVVVALVVLLLITSGRYAW